MAGKAELLWKSAPATGKIPDAEPSLSAPGTQPGKGVALDLPAVNLSSSAIGQLVANLEERNIRVLGIEGVDPAKWNLGFPCTSRRPRLANLRAASVRRPRRPDS